MTNRLATTVFTSGIKDALAVVDVYAKTSAIDPAYTAIAKNVINQQLMAAMMGKKTSTNLLLGNLKALAGVAINDISKGLIARVPSLQAGFSLASPILQKILSSPTSFTNAITAQSVAIQNSAYKSVGTAVTSLTNTASASDITAVTTMLSGLGNQASTVAGYAITDQGSQIALATNLLCTAANFNIPGAYKLAASSLTDRTVLASVTSNILPTMISSGNVSMLADMANGPCANIIKSLAPKLASSYMSKYVSPKLAGKGGALVAGALVSGLNLMNKNWSKIQTSAGEEIVNGNVVANASPDFKSLMADSNAQDNKALFTTPSTTVLDATELPYMTENAISRIESADNYGSYKAVDKMPNGGTVTYTLDRETHKCTKVVEVPAPVPTDPVAWAGFDNSKIDNDLCILHHVDVSCEVDSATQNGGVSMGSNATSALNEAFPYTAFAGAQDQYDTLA